MLCKSYTLNNLRKIFFRMGNYEFYCFSNIDLQSHFFNSDKVKHIVAPAFVPKAFKMCRVDFASIINTVYCVATAAFHLT